VKQSALAASCSKARVCLVDIHDLLLEPTCMHTRTHAHTHIHIVIIDTRPFAYTYSSV
jgi:hypothetical protein